MLTHLKVTQSNMFGLQFGLRRLSIDAFPRTCAWIYASLGLYEEAVGLTLDFDVNLAKEYAMLPGISLSRKMWVHPYLSLLLLEHTLNWFLNAGASGSWLPSTLLRTDRHLQCSAAYFRVDLWTWISQAGHLRVIASLTWIQCSIHRRYFGILSRFRCHWYVQVRDMRFARWIQSKFSNIAGRHKWIHEEFRGYALWNIETKHWFFHDSHQYVLCIFWLKARK